LTTFVLTAVLFLAAVMAMVAAVLITGRSLKGSCGGPSCTCVAEGKDLLSCDGDNGETASLPLHPGR